MAETMRLDIVTPQRAVFSAEANFVLVPTIDGAVGILPNHAPLISALSIGAMKVVIGGKEQFFAVNKGFLEVKNNRVVILADTAESAEEIDLERAKAAKERAEKRLTGNAEEIDHVRARAALARANARISTISHM